MREYLWHVNLVWGILGSWLLLMLGVYLLRGTGRSEARRAAIALATFFLFDTGLRYWIWWVLTPGRGYVKLEAVTLLITLGATLGMICLCRVFAPTSLGHWGWMIPFGCIVLGLGMSLHLTNTWSNLIFWN